MKKSLSIVSLLIIFIFAIGIAGAADADNITDDSLMSVSSGDFDILDSMSMPDKGLEVYEIEADYEEHSNISDSNNKEDILFNNAGDTPVVYADSADGKEASVLCADGAEGKETPQVYVDDVTLFEGENVVIPFNVTDSNGVLICGEVNITVSGENNTFSRIITIKNASAQFETADLIEIIKSNREWNISDVFYMVNSSMNFTNGNISEIIMGCGDVYNGLCLNISEFVMGIEDIINGSDVNVSRFMEGLENIKEGINISVLMNGLDDLMNLSNFNFSAFAGVLNALGSGFDLNLSDIINNIYHGLSFNLPLFMQGINGLNNEFGFFEGGSLISALKGLGLKFSISLLLKTTNLLLKNPVPISEIIALFNEILDFNKLTPADFVKMIFNKQDDGSNFNFTDFIYKIANSRYNKDNIANSLSKIIHSVSLDYAALNSVIDNADLSYFNSSRFIDALTDSGLINMFEGLNSSDIIDGIYKVMVASRVNTSAIIEGLNKICTSFKFSVPAVNGGWNKICSSFNCNDSMIMNGLDRIIAGLGINISGLAGQMIDEYGYSAGFSESLGPGVYNISVNYLSNEIYNSAINDTAKLNVLNKKESPILVNAYVNDYNVLITGNIDNATGICLLMVDDYCIFIPVINGNFSYDSSFAPGDYNFTLMFPGNSQLNENSSSVSFTVRLHTKITASKLSTTYGTSKKLLITLKDENGNVVVNRKVTVKLNGKSYSGQTNSKGQISITVPANLAPKTYTASIAFAGDDKYIKSSGTVKVVVSKAKSTLTAKNKSFKLKPKTKSYSVTIKTDKGKAMKNAKVTLRVNGKTYTAKTNSKGVATFKINKLSKKGTYKATVKFAGSTYYKAVSKTVKITVKK